MPMISNQMNVFCENHFIFRGNSILLQGGKLPDEKVVRRCLEMNAADDWFAELAFNYSAILLEKSTPNPAGCEDIPLRQYFWDTKQSKETKILGTLAARAKGLLNFRKTKRFCSICGAPLQDDPKFTARTCIHCGHQFFPQLEPAVIVLVKKDDKILLAKHKNRNDDVYSTLAGFVEMGETIEHAVKREIKEETNIHVKNIKYVSSQAWPYPDQLMLAFTAEYDSGEIKIQQDELLDAQWFSRDSLPTTPPPGSVAHNLIHDNF